jgi:hypothetical protein
MVSSISSASFIIFLLLTLASVSSMDFIDNHYKQSTYRIILEISTHLSTPNKMIKNIYDEKKYHQIIVWLD